MSAVAVPSWSPSIVRAWAHSSETGQSAFEPPSIAGLPSRGGRAAVLVAPPVKGPSSGSPTKSVWTSLQLPSPLRLKPPLEIGGLVPLMQSALSARRRSCRSA